ncbi:endolytic transglycosylase MltG [Flavobacteriaceae bacterium F89]|uniref:Endolytic murein transglycosylase n=1 Tax=Cerina litoralis TaxID=2874477 RepID=A0AAE3JT16_9FLAO|nr:endolytic transglycosylase MltG [Cerina litoralis]MCG2461087.1 endolytic transglycosylase MltG [Cerina litoralis]
MYIRKIIAAIALLGLVAAGIWAYSIYRAIFSPNTSFGNEEAYVYVHSDDDFGDVVKILRPLLGDMSTFETVAQKKGYTSNVKPGKYGIRKGMNNNEIINALRSNNLPVKVSFNNQETLNDLAGRISAQIEADSVSLFRSFTDSVFLRENGFNEATRLAMYIPNSYEFFWNTAADAFRGRMLKEYKRFWTEDRLNKAKKIGLTPIEVITLASIVNKETAKVEERPRVAGLYLNRLNRHMLLQADPTVIHALKLHSGDFTKVYKRVLYKDLELDSPYNTYKYIGLPPGPIAMPDISSIDAVLNPEKNDYYYMVADVERFGYHKFAKDLAQHNRNKEQYIRWINSQKINR